MYYLLFICRKVCFGFIFISISFNTRFFTFVCHGTWLCCSPCSPSSLLSICIIDKVTSRIIFKDLRSYLFFQLICIRNFTYVYISNFWRKFASYVNVYFFNFVKVITNTDFLFRFQYFNKFSIFVFKFKYMKHYIFFLHLNLNRHSLSTFWKSDRSFHMIDFFKLNFNIQKEKCLNFYLQ